MNILCIQPRPCLAKLAYLIKCMLPSLGTSVCMCVRVYNCMMRWVKLQVKGLSMDSDCLYWPATAHCMEEERSVHSNKGRGKGYGRQQILHLQSKERLHYKLNYKVDKKKQVLYSVFCLGKLHAALWVHGSCSNSLHLPLRENLRSGEGWNFTPTLMCLRR